MMTYKRIILLLVTIGFMSQALYGFALTNSLKSMAQQAMINQSLNTAQQLGSNVVRNYLFSNPSTIPQQQLNNPNYGIPFNGSIWAAPNLANGFQANPTANLLPNLTPQTNNNVVNTVMPFLTQTTQLGTQQLPHNNSTNLNSGNVTNTMSNLTQQVPTIVTQTTQSPTPNTMLNRTVNGGISQQVMQIVVPQSTPQQMWLLPQSTPQAMVNGSQQIPTALLLSNPQNFRPNTVRPNDIPFMNNLNALEQQIMNRPMPQVILPSTNPINYNNGNTLFMALPQAVQQKAQKIPNTCGCK